MLLNDLTLRPAQIMSEGHPDLVDSQTFIGLEYEIENLTREEMRTRLPFFRTVEDHSLRGGREWVLRNPLQGVSLVESIDSVSSTFIADKNYTSDRTSLHVHLDVRDLNSDQLLNLIKVYLYYEHSLVEHASSERANWYYCRPVYKTLNSIEHLQHVFRYKDDAAQLTSMLQAWQKYSAFNLQPIISQGSVEFRHSRLLLDRQEVLQWVNTILELKQMAINYDDINWSEYQPLGHIDSTESDYFAGYLLVQDIINNTRYGATGTPLDTPDDQVDIDEREAPFEMGVTEQIIGEV